LEEISIQWGTLPKVLPTDKDEIKQQMQSYLIPPSGTTVPKKFLQNLRTAKKASRRKNQEEILVQHLDEMFDEIMAESAYDYLSQGEGFNRLLGRMESEKNKSKEDIKKITLKSLVSDTQVTNDLIGFSFMRFGRDLDKIPDYPFFKEFEDIGTEVEFKLKETWSEKEQMPSGNYSFTVSNHSNVKDAHGIIDIPPEDFERLVESKSKYIKEQGVKSARFIRKGHAKYVVAKESFPFPFTIEQIDEYSKKAFASIIVSPDGKNPSSIDKLFEGEELQAVAAKVAAVKADGRTKSKFSHEGVDYTINSFGFLGEGKSNLGFIDATKDFEDAFDNWAIENKSKIIKPIEATLKDLETVKTATILCKVTTEMRSTGKFGNYWKKANPKKKDPKIILDDEGNPIFIEVNGKKVPMKEAIEQPNIKFEIKDEETGQYRPMTEADSKRLDEEGNYKVKVVEEDEQGRVSLREIKTQKDFEEEIAVGNSYPLEELNEVFQQAQINLTYMVTGHGYFDFSPFNRGSGSTGMNQSINKHIDKLKKRVRRLTRQGVSI
jgi:hypothetical protein